MWDGPCVCVFVPPPHARIRFMHAAPRTCACVRACVCGMVQIGMSSVAIISSSTVTVDAASRVCAAASAAGHAANLFRVTPLDAPACVIRAARTGFDVVVVFQAGSEDVNTVSNTAGVPVLRVCFHPATVRDRATSTCRCATLTCPTNTVYRFLPSQSAAGIA